MQGQDHLKAAPVLGLLYFAGGPESVIIAIVASLFIDLDHLHLLIKEKAFTVRRIVELSQKIYDEDSIKKCFLDVTYVLHSVEMNLLLIILAYWYTPIIYVVIGFSFHIICDVIHHRRHKLPIISWLILTTYFIRLSERKVFVKRAEV